jgi:hypothetical protein
MNSLPRRAPIATVALLAAGVTGCAGARRAPLTGAAAGRGRIGERRHRPPTHAGDSLFEAGHMGIDYRYPLSLAWLCQRIAP